MQSKMLGAIVIGSVLVAAPAWAQQQESVTGALGTGSIGLSLGGGSTSPTGLSTPSSIGSFGSPTGPTLGTLGGFSGTTAGGGSLSTPLINPPSSPSPFGAPNPSTGLVGPGR
jgi:hypothetical protein